MDAMTLANALSRILQVSNINSHQWSFFMKFLLDSDDLWEHVQSPTTAEYAEIMADTPRASTPTLIPNDAWKKKKKAAYLIYQSG